MERPSKYVEMKRGSWSADEDLRLISFIERNGHSSWSSLPAKAGLLRCGKSCRLRWTNYLNPEIKRGKFSLEEENQIIQLHALLGNKWSAIARHLPRRTDNDIKNHWNTFLKKKLIRMGIDPATHKPKVSPFGGSGQFSDAGNLNHMAQWESARLEAESRQALQSRIFNYSIKPTSNFSGPPKLKGFQLGRTWKSINNGFFNPGGTLESPSSVLKFSDSALSITTTSRAAAAPTLVADNNQLAPFSPGMITKKSTDNIINDDDDEIIANLSACFEEPPSLLGGFNNIQDVDDLVPLYHGSCSGTGVLEDNRKYWNKP